MSLAQLANALGWCALINYAVLMVWFILLLVLRDWTYSIHTRWFRLNRDTFDLVHYAGMGLFKLFIWMFNLAPYIALRIIGA